jgi:hypothetical protein
VLATVAALVLALAPSAGAETVQLPVGEAQGVRIVRERGAIVVVFTARAARLWRRVAGKRVSVFCEERSGPDEDGFVTVEEGGTTFRAPRRGRRLGTGDLTRGMDICRVWLEARTLRRNGMRQRYGRELIVAIPLTQEGAVRLDERARTYALFALLEIAAHRGSNVDGFPTSADLVALVPVLPRPIRLSVVALPTPADTPPAGSIGYYSDGGAACRDGRRLGNRATAVSRVRRRPRHPHEHARVPLRRRVGARTRPAGRRERGRGGVRAHAPLSPTSPSYALARAALRAEARSRDA